VLRIGKVNLSQKSPVHDTQTSTIEHRIIIMLTITLAHVLTLSSLLLALGVAGIVINRRNIIAILMCLELVLLAVSLNLIGTAHFRNDLGGQVFSFFILTVAAAELAIGLAIVTLFFRNRGNIDIDSADLMKG